MSLRSHRHGRLRHRNRLQAPQTHHKHFAYDIAFTVDWPSFRRVIVPQSRHANSAMPTPPDTSDQHDGEPTVAYTLSSTTENGINCGACRTYHLQGQCPLKLAGVEHCNLCGMAHFGHARVCPHIQSETQVCLEIITRDVGMTSKLKQ
jgi:hypothetical protein